MQVKRLNAGVCFTLDDGRTRPFPGRGLRVPTLDEVLARYRGLPIVIEVKEPEAVGPIKDALRRSDCTQHVLLDSATHAAVAPFRESGLSTGASLSEVVRLIPRSWFSACVNGLPYQALCIPRWYKGIPVPVLRLARAARGAGVATHVWTINEAATARALWRAGINGIITDDPGLMLQARATAFAS
jgi:glycerophosphoryl diester phosphodiesterase